MNAAWKDLILDHYKNPRFYGADDEADFSSEQHNRTCGDNVKVFAAMDKGHSRWSFIGAGCSLSLASGSLMMELLQGKTREEVIAVRDAFKRLWDEGLKDDSVLAWSALEGLRSYPVRSRCVLLAWKGLDEILEAWPAT